MLSNTLDVKVPMLSTACYPLTQGRCLLSGCSTFLWNAMHCSHLHYNCAVLALKRTPDYPFCRPLLPPARRLAIICGMFSPGVLFTISASSSNSTIQPLRPHLWRETGWFESPTSGTLYSRFPPTSLVVPAYVCFFYQE